MNVLVFKTDLHNPDRVNDAKPILENISGIRRWNVDMQDCDNVLRIETAGLSPRSVEIILQEAGYYCQELPD